MDNTCCSDCTGRLDSLIDAAELEEPGAMSTLATLKLSGAKQFDDKAGGCALL